MMLKLFYLIKYCFFLFVLGLFVPGCSQGDFFVLDSNLLDDAELISTYITGKKNKSGDQGEIIGEETCDRNFSKAHELFSLLENKLDKYPEETGYPIYINTLKNLLTVLKKLEPDIDGLPNGSEKSRFNEEYKKLTEHVYALINKDPLVQPPIDNYPLSQWVEFNF